MTSENIYFESLRSNRMNDLLDFRFALAKRDK